MAKLLLTVSDVLKAESWTTKHNVKIIYTCVGRLYHSPGR